MMLLTLLLISPAWVFCMKGFSDLFPRKTTVSTITYTLNPASIALIPTVESLNEELSLLNPHEDILFKARKTGRGPPSHAADIRLFDAPDGFEPTVTLYRDKAAWCPYCEKVWLQLEEKRIPYRIHKSPLRCYGEKTKEHLRVNPSGMLPVANINGKIISESNVIMQELEDAFPLNKPLLPRRGSPEDQRVPGLLKLERKVFSIWFSWLTSRSSDSSARQMESVLKQIDNELNLTAGPYFLGSELSLVDIMFTPFLERMAASLPYFKGFQVRCSKYPYLNRWFEAMDSRETYRGIKSDYYTHCHDLPPQIGSCYSLPEAASFASEIDGDAWQVSFKDGLEPMIPEDASEARRDAARALLNNLEYVVKFAARGAGVSGPPFGAVLADPHGVPNESMLRAVDPALRLVVVRLVRGSDAMLPPVGDIGFPIEIIACLEYLRDRVGVPRDVSVHGARQLRAHINMLIDEVQEVYNAA